MEVLLELIKISRPRFWLYIAGPVIVGAAFARPLGQLVFDPIFLFILLIFLFPANLFIYSVNDIFDLSTDKFNPKKIKKEEKVTDKNKKIYIGSAILSLSILLLPFLLNISFYSKLIIALFIFLSFFYSAYPLRFKSIPVLDFSSNILYALPGIMIYYEFARDFPDPMIIFAIFLWTSAMHLFSAIPDISYDTKAGVKTSAVFLGQNFSLLLCAVLWGIFSFIVISYNFLFFPSLIYPIIPLLIYTRRKNIIKEYWKLPTINMIMGFLLFLYAAASFNQGLSFVVQ